MTIKKQIYDAYNENKDSLINILAELLDNGEEPEIIAELIKEDNNLYMIYKNECLQNNLLKKDLSGNLNDVFGEL